MFKSREHWTYFSEPCHLIREHWAFTFRDYGNMAPFRLEWLKCQVGGAQMSAWRGSNGSLEGLKCQLGGAYMSSQSIGAKNCLAATQYQLFTLGFNMLSLISFYQYQPDTMHPACLLIKTKVYLTSLSLGKT